MSQITDKTPSVSSENPYREILNFDDASDNDNLLDDKVTVKIENVDPMDVEDVDEYSHPSTSRCQDGEHYSEEENVYYDVLKFQNDFIHISSQPPKLSRNTQKRMEKHNDLLNFTEIGDKSLIRNKRIHQISKKVCDHHLSKKNSLICDVCNEEFINQDDLAKHIGIHKGKKLYICECGKGINSSRSAMESEAWKHYKKINNQDYAVCNYCSKKLSIKGSSTTGLLRHLKSKHPTIKYNITAKNKFDDNTEILQNKKIKMQTMIPEFLQNISLAAILAQLAAMDGLPVYSIANSTFIRQAISDNGYIPPTKVSDVMKLIKEYYNEMKNNLIAKLQLIKYENKKFSFTIDEWRCRNDRIFMNIHIYYSNSECYNLGLVRIRKRDTAENMLENIKSKLNDFGLNFLDVVGFTSNMKDIMNLEELIPINRQLCYNHALQNAIIETMYVKVDEGYRESDNEVSDYSDDDLSENFKNNEGKFYILRNEIDITLNPVRNIVKYFKSSQSRNAVLQKIAFERYNGEFPLVLDRRMQWSTIEVMIERFLKIKEAVDDALKFLNKSVYIIDAKDLHDIENLLNILKPIKLAVEALSATDANLIMSEGVFKFLFETLRENDSIIAKDLLSTIMTKIDSRRNCKLVSVIQFLQNPEVIKSNNEYFVLPLMTKEEIINYANKLNDKLFPNESTNEEKNSYSKPECTESTLSEKLKNKINGCFQTMPVYDNCNKPLSLQLAMYELNGRMTPNIKQLLKALKTIKPASMKSRRAFSVNENFVINKWSSLKDDSIDALCFLESHFYLNKIEK